MQKGIIICTSSNLYQVEINKQIYSCLARGKFKNQNVQLVKSKSDVQKESNSPLVGDLVEITITDEIKKEGVIEKILPRKNELKRPKMANLTQLIFVLSMQMPQPDLLLLDKQLAFAKWKQIDSIICFNKIDLVEENKIQELSKIYKNIGYKVIETNAKEKENIEKIKPFLNNHITVLAGNSGVGKSTLINGIFNKELTQEGSISNKNKKGKNTTTSVTLYFYNTDSYLADTPGFSTFEILEIPSEDIDQYFVEFIPYLSKCEFAGCNHNKEENCGVKQAVEEGKISIQRYQNYQKIYEESKEKEKRKW